MSPIKGVSNIRRLPRAGKIHLGIKDISKKTKKEFPRAVDYFVVRADGSTPSDASEGFKKVYGEAPKVLGIVFPCEDDNVFFPQWYKRYGQASKASPAGILLCKGDGEAGTRMDPETGQLKELECNPNQCEYYAKKHCRRVGNLQFFLPSVPIPGIWQIDTSSFNGIVNINSGIEMLRWNCSRVSGVPLWLRIVTKSVSPEGKRKNVWVMDVRPMHPDEAKRVFAKQNWLAEMRRVSERGISALPAPDDAAPTDLYPASSRQLSSEQSKETENALAVISPKVAGDGPEPPQEHRRQASENQMEGLRHKINEFYVNLKKTPPQVESLEKKYKNDDYALYRALWMEWNRQDG